MGDRLEELMTNARAAIDESVAAGLAEKPRIEDYLTVRPSGSATPFRLATPRWTSRKTKEGAAFSLHQFNPEIEGAWEVRIEMPLTVGDLRDNVPGALERVRKLAIRAREAERRAALHVLALDHPPTTLCLIPQVKEEVERLQGPCRLISPDGFAGQAKKLGLVEEAIDFRPDLPDGVSAMLIRMSDGPTLRRLDGDFSLSWGRTSARAVELRLSERFFLDGREGAATFKPA